MSYNTVLASIFSGVGIFLTGIMSFFTPSTACLAKKVGEASGQIHRLNDLLCTLVADIDCALPWLVFMAKVLAIWLVITAACLITMAIASCFKTKIVVPPSTTSQIIDTIKDKISGLLGQK